MNIKDLMKNRLLCRTSDPVRARVLAEIIAGAREIARTEQRSDVTAIDIEKAAESNAKGVMGARKIVMKETRVDIDDASLASFNELITISKEFYPPTTEDIELAIFDTITRIPADKLSNKSMGLIRKEVMLKFKGKSIDVSFVMATAKLLIQFVTFVKKNKKEVDTPE